MDTKGHQFQAQGIGETNGRKLGGRIKAGFGSCDETRHADDVDDVPLACFLHVRTHQAWELHEGKGIDFKHGMNLLIGNLVKLFKNPIACVVDQDINLSIALIELFYQILDGWGISDIDPDAFSLRMTSIELFQFFLIST